MPPEPERPGSLDPRAARGEEAHLRALESLYRSAPINGGFSSQIEIAGPGVARIRFQVDPAHFHAAAAAHGTLYFKMMDDAAFYACNSTISDRFLLTTAFNLVFSRPLKGGEVVAEGRWISGRRRVLIGEARLIDSTGEEAARGTGTFMRSHIALSSLPGYRGNR
jgi:uncharacterized protein (TIGR00369 family)